MTRKVGDGLGGYTIVDDGPEVVPMSARLRVEHILQSVRNFATLSEALRILGAGVLLASMSVFLLQGWNDGNDIRRYLLLLTQTGMLAAAGFAMSHGLKEAKGARVFFGLALVSVPANFTILGALLYSVFQWDGALTTYPGYATWTIENVASTGVTLAGAMLVLLPVTIFCFAVMARHSAKSLSMNFLLLNLLLLIPIRSSLAAGTIALLGILYAVHAAGMMTRNDRALTTGEGRFALSTMFIPLSIIVFRSMYFYQVDSLMVAMVLLAFYLAARQASLFPDRNERIALGLETLSVPLALLVAISLTDALSPALANAIEVPFFAVVYTAMAFDLLRRTASRKLTKLISVSISLVAALSFIFSVAVFPGAATALLCLAVGGLLLLAGFSLNNKTALISGVVTLLAGATFGLDAIVHLVITSGWIELAIFGALTIALASLLERHGVAVKLRVTKWFKEGEGAKIAGRQTAANDQHQYLQTGT